MIAEPAVLSFPRALVFPDVDAPVLARDEGASLDARGLLDGAWTDYLRRVLPPIAEPPPPRTLQAPTLSPSPCGLGLRARPRLGEGSGSA